VCIIVPNIHLFYGPLDFVWDYPGEPIPEPILILLMQETVSGSGISWAKGKSAPDITMPAPHHSVFYSPDALPAPNQQCQSTEGKLLCQILLKLVKPLQGYCICPSVCYMPVLCQNSAAEDCANNAA